MRRISEGGPVPKPGHPGLRRPVRRAQVVLSLLLALTTGLAAGLLIWNSIRPATLADLLWCRSHPQEVTWAAIAFQIDVAEEGVAEACALARHVGADRLERLVEEERVRLPEGPDPPRIRA